MSNAPVIFDRALLAARRRRARASGPVTFLLDRVAADVIDRLSVVSRTFDIAVDLGTPADSLRDALAFAPGIGRVVAAVPAGSALPNTGLVADEEALPFRAGSIDLIVSALALQLVNDLPGTLLQIRRALRPDGLFLAALLGGDTLSELRQSFAAAEAELTSGMSPRVAPFANVRELGALLQRAGFALPVADVDRLTVRYETPFALMRDLRLMGAANMLSERRRVFLSRNVLARAAEIYTERFADPDGRIRATFDVAWLSGWAPHESQQKPLRPGSAKARLADALGAAEQSAGEKPVGR